MQEQCVSVRLHLFKLLQRCLSRALCTQYSQPRLAESFIGAARTSGLISHIPLSMYTRSSVCKHKPVFEFFCSHILLRQAMMVTFAPESLMSLPVWVFIYVLFFFVAEGPSGNHYPCVVFRAVKPTYAGTIVLQLGCKVDTWFGSTGWFV